MSVRSNMPYAVRSKASWTSQCRCWVIPLLGLIVLLLVYRSDGAADGSTGQRASSLGSRHYRRTPDAHKRSTPPGLDVPKPPQAPRVYLDTPDSLQQMVIDYGEREKSIVQKIIDNVPAEEATFKNTIVPYIHHENEALLNVTMLGFYAYLSPKKELQAAARELSSMLDSITQLTYLNDEYFTRVNKTYHKQQNDTELNEEDHNLLYTLPHNFQTAGLAVAKGEERGRYSNISQELTVVAGEFVQATIEDNATLWFTRDELNGTNEDILSTLEKGTGEHEGFLKLALRSETDVGAVMSYCTNETTRQTVLIARANRVPDNVARLKEAVVLRDESSRLLGKPSFAAARIEDNMAKTPAAVHQLLNKVRERVRPTAEREIAHLQELKKADTGNDGPLFMWDVAHYTQQSYEREYHVDTNKIKEYFPSEPTMHAILDMYAELFHLQFVKLEGKDRDELSPTGNGADLTYHPDVELYAVWDGEAGAAQHKRSEADFVGYLYLDMFERAGKAGGAYTTPVDPGFEKEDGSRHFPTCVMVTNFKKSTSNNPSLLLRSEVQTILHELGHAMHQLTSRVTYARFHGPGGCPPDFFEAPSQLLENWVFEPKVLKRLSKHWSYLSEDAKAAWTQQQNTTKAVQPPEQMPDDMIAAIRNSRNAFSSNGELAQVFLASFDLQIHEPATHADAKAIDTTDLYNRLDKNITGIDGPEVLGKGYKWGHPESSMFTHIMTGYEAAYYSYQWSRVYCKDLFYTAFKQDPFSSEQGGRFRKLVLEPGGSKDFYAMLTEFLGHEPSDQAYFEDLELDKQ